MVLRDASASKNITFSPFRKKIPEKFSGFSIKGMAGVPPISAKGFLEKWFSVKGVGGGGTPLTEKIRQVVFEGHPKVIIQKMKRQQKRFS